MTKNPKSKKNFVGNLKKMIAPGETYVFPEGVRMALYYWGNIVLHNMVAIEHVKGTKKNNGTIVVHTTVVDGGAEKDNIMDFSFGEIAMIYNYVETHL